MCCGMSVLDASGMGIGFVAPGGFEVGSGAKAVGVFKMDVKALSQRVVYPANLSGYHILIKNTHKSKMEYKREYQVHAINAFDSNDLHARPAWRPKIEPKTLHTLPVAMTCNSVVIPDECGSSTLTNKPKPRSCTSAVTLATSAQLIKAPLAMNKLVGPATIAAATVAPVAPAAKPAVTPEKNAAPIAAKLASAMVLAVTPKTTPPTSSMISGNHGMPSARKGDATISTTLFNIPVGQATLLKAENTCVATLPTINVCAAVSQVLPSSTGAKALKP